MNKIRQFKKVNIFKHIDTFNDKLKKRKALAYIMMANNIASGAAFVNQLKSTYGIDKVRKAMAITQAVVNTASSNLKIYNKIVHNR